MSIKRLFAILFIYAATAFAWFILGGAIDLRTRGSHLSTGPAVLSGWGPALTQLQPAGYYQNPGSRDGRSYIRPSSGAVTVELASDPKRKGLIWYRTYGVNFHGEYVFENPTPIPQTIFIQFQLPSPESSYTGFSYTLNDRPTTANVNGREPVTEAVTLAPGGKATLAVAYQTRGLDRWSYSFGTESRVQNFTLGMTTDFEEIDFPEGTASPTTRTAADYGWRLLWSYPDEIGARPIGMDMPKVLNPGPTAARITFFAPVSLLFFFTVLVLTCLLRGIDMHPMNYFFLSAGCFAFQLLFAYLVDLVPFGLAFIVAALVSLALVSGYLLLAFGIKFARLAALAQFGYMILFSYSFFFDGLTGLTITVGAISTLALLMALTARVNWSDKFRKGPTPPPVPTSASH